MEEVDNLIKVEEEKSSWEYIGKEGEYSKYKITKNGITYYLIVEGDNHGNLKQIFEKPNFNQLPKDVHASGAHLVMNNPKENHYDHFYKGREWKEKEKDFEYPFWHSDNPLGI